MSSCFRYVHVTLLLGSIGWGCGAAPTSDVAPYPTLDSHPLDTVDSEAQSKISELIARVAQVRGLPVKGSIAGQTIDRATMRRQLKEQIEAQIPREAVLGESAFLSVFGFVPDEFDYEAQMLSMMESQLAGYYDPDCKTLFVMADMEGAEAESTLVHELVHALQDQHYDLGPMLKYQPNASDAAGAVHALAEGDATSAMLDYSLADKGHKAYEMPDSLLRKLIVDGMASDSVAASAPRILRESIVAPYVDGTLFVHALRRRGDWALVDRAWRDPPTSSEQLLHVEKWESHDQAELVREFSGPPGSGWVNVHSDVFGEQSLRIALEEWMSYELAAKAAAGWAGDRAGVWEHRDLGIMAAAWRIRFDRAGVDGSAEAKEAYSLVATSWNQPNRRAPCRKVGSDGQLAVVSRGRDVVFAAGAGPLGIASSGSRCARAIEWATAILSKP